MVYWKKVAHSIIFILLIISTLFFLTIPSFQRINRINRIIINQKTHLEKLYLQGQLLKKIKQQLLDVKPLINQLSDKFILPEQDIQFITQLESLAKNNKVQQDISFKTEQKKDKKFYQIIPVQLYLRGNFKNLMYYIRDLQQDHYYLTFNSINIINSNGEIIRSTEQNNRSLTNISLTLDAQSYWLDNK